MIPSCQSHGSDVRGWEGNRRSGIAVAMNHKLQWFIQLRAQVLSKVDEHASNTAHGALYLSLPECLLSTHESLK